MVKHRKKKKSQYSKAGFSRMDYTYKKSKDIDQMTAVNLTQLTNTTTKPFCTKLFNLYPFYETLCSQGEKMSPFP